MEFFDLFGFPQVLVLVFTAVNTTAYFIMMSERLNLRLFTFFIVSLGMTLAFSLTAIVFIPSVWVFIGLPECVLFDIGSLLHLIDGKRTVKEVVALK